MRRYKRARPKWRAWGFAVLVPALFLFALFSLLPYDAMVGRWPLGIRNAEVMAYQPWFDHRPGQAVDVELPVVGLSGNGSAARWDSAGVAAPVEVVATRGAEVLLRSAQAPGRALWPASIGSLRDLYVKLLADTFGVHAPAISLVSFERDGGDQGVHVLERVPAGDAPLKGLPADVLLLGIGDRDHAVAPLRGEVPAAALRTSHEDDRLWGAYALLLYARDRIDLPAGEAAFAFDPVLGRVLPLYHALPADTTGQAHRPLAAFAHERLRSDGTRAAMQALAAQLLNDSAYWTDRLGAVDGQWEPALAGGRSLGLTGASTRTQRMEFLARLFHPDPVAFFGEARSTPVGLPVAAAAIPGWMERFRSEPDTIRLPRGKYDVDEDIILPRGTALVLERGARLFMAPGVRLVVDAPLHARGTALNPVFIRPQDASRPYGAVIVRGDGATECCLRGVRMSGGAGAEIDGVRYGASLSFVRCRVTLAESDIEAPGQDALLEVRRGAVDFLNTRFGKGARAAVRLQDVRGTLRNCTFTGGPEGLVVEGGDVRSEATGR